MTTNETQELNLHLAEEMYRAIGIDGRHPNPKMEGSPVRYLVTYLDEAGEPVKYSRPTTPQ
jgi:hypothetical protein